MAAKQVNRKCLPLILILVSFLFLVIVPAAFALPLKRLKSLTVIKEVNREGPYLGLLTVSTPEDSAFFATGAFQPHKTHLIIDLSGRRFRVGKIHDKKVLYVRCGVGMVNSAAATQQMLDLFDVKGIIHFGVSGNVNDSLSIGDVVIPKQFGHTGIWDWLNLNGTSNLDHVAELNVASYNVPKGKGNLLGLVGYSEEEFYSEFGKPNIAQSLLWVQASKHWLQLAANLEGMELKQCVNSSLCLPRKPKLVVGLRGATSNTFVDNAPYRNFLVRTFGVSSTDMESSAVVMTITLSNGFPVIALRGLSDLAGKQSGENAYTKFGSLAAYNAAKAVVQFIKILQ
ncbi:bark storage protein A-like [Quercus robur]|uniref:bark storage protein A-like n=1 Tax=Quercus robur TaxID=38942 RepID=UPI0021612331|nr:bark storage protein A-like [Quercus robur]